MFNIRWSAIAGGFAFILSLLISLVSGAGIFSLVRAGIFGGIFFILGSGVYWAISMFLSDLFDRAAPEPARAKVDITLEGDDGLIAESGMDGLADLVGDASNPTVLDQLDEDAYNASEGLEEAPGPRNAGSFGYAIPIDGLDSIDTLPNFEGASAMQPLAVEETMENPINPPPPERRPSVNSAQPAELDGDFQAKEIAQAIQTILKRE